jgi:hypothetical protein
MMAWIEKNADQLMVGTNFLETLVLVLLGSGGAAFIWTVTRSYLAVRSRVDLREDKALERMERNEGSMQAQMKRQREWGMYWYRRAAVLETELIKHSIPVPPPIGVPPED